MTVAEQVFEAVKTLPDPLARQVLDFAAFLRTRSETAEWRDLTAAQASALASIWDNDEDGVWDGV